MPFFFIERNWSAGERRTDGLLSRNAGFVVELACWKIDGSCCWVYMICFFKLFDNKNQDFFHEGPLAHSLMFWEEWPAWEDRNAVPESPGETAHLF